MDNLSPEIIEEHSHAHDLQLILRSTLSHLGDHAPYIRSVRSLRVLELALQSAVADLEEIDPTRDECAPTDRQAKP